MKSTTSHSITLLFLSVALLASCSASESKKNDLEFDVNQKLLGEIFTDSVSGIAIQIPIGWKNSSRFTNDTLKAKLDRLHLDSLGKTMYLDSAQQASLLISKINEGEDLQLTYQNPDSIYNRTNQWASITKSEFTLNGMRTYQFLLQNKSIVNFKLLITNSSKKTIMLDYIVERTVYLKQVKKIESSIGSVKAIL